MSNNKSHMKSPDLVRGKALPRPAKCFGHLVTARDGSQFSLTTPGCNCKGEKEGRAK